VRPFPQNSAAHGDGGWAMRPVSRLATVGLGIYFWAFVTFLFIPLVVLVIFSVNKSTIPALPLSGFTTHWFRQAFSNGELTTALVRSVVIALVAAVLATAFGIMASLALLPLPRPTLSPPPPV